MREGASSAPLVSGQRIQQRHDIEPYAQGDLDELCGLYAIVNGIRLANHPKSPLSRTDSMRVFHRGWRFLDRRGYADAVREGVSSDLWIKLADHVARYAAKHGIARIHLGRIAQHEEPEGLPRTIAVIEETVVGGTPVAVELRKSLNHFTVVSAVTDERWILFDSYGYRWIEKRSLGTRGARARHIIGSRAISFHAA